MITTKKEDLPTEQIGWKIRCPEKRGAIILRVSRERLWRPKFQDRCECGECAEIDSFQGSERCEPIERTVCDRKLAVIRSQGVYLSKSSRLESWGTLEHAETFETWGAAREQKAQISYRSDFRFRGLETVTAYVYGEGDES